MTENKNNKILMIPDFSEVNAYQQELQTALQAHGANVIASDSIGHFAVLGAIQNHGLPDVLHLHWLQPFVISDNLVKTAAGGFRLLCELALLKSFGVTIVWTVHNILEHRERAPRLERLIKHFVVRLSDTVIVHCVTAREAVIQAYHLPQSMKHKCRVVPHGHYIDSYPNSRTKTEARAAMNSDFNDSQIVYLFFGQIRPYKNVPGLINSFKEINSPDARLMIVGNPWDEEEAKKVRKLAQSDERIQAVIEFIPDEEIQLYMNAADVVVLPFRKILTSGSAILAMSFGKALIAPNKGCVGELLDPEGGFVYDPDSKNGLRNAMQRALNSDLKSMGEYNYQKASERDWQTIARQTLKVYNSG